MRGSQARPPPPLAPDAESPKFAVVWFYSPPPREPGHDQGPTRPRLPVRWLQCACGVAILTACFPWTHILHTRLWGPGDGPRGLETTAGFTVLMASVLCLLLSLLEDRNPHASDAVRPGVLATMIAAGLSLALTMRDGPGNLGGVTASFTGWFHAGVLAIAAGLYVAIQRHRRAASS